MKIKVAKLATRALKQRPAAVSEQRVRDAKGKLVSVFTLDPNNPAFEAGLTFAYSSNVARARAENTRLFGSPDGLRRDNRRTTATRSVNASGKK